MNAGCKNFLVICVWSVCMSLAHCECPFGYIHFQDSCYYFSTETLDWYEAEESCRHHNGRLAEINNKQQSDFIIAAAKRAAGFSGVHGYWLGGRDDVVEGDWRWESSFKPFTYTHWAPGEPNNDKHVDEDCLNLHLYASMLWNDDRCSRTDVRYICETPYQESEIPIAG